MSAPIERLEWDSAHFGFPIARVSATRLDEPTLAAALAACAAERIRCAYLLLDADDAHGCALAQAAGFVLRDVRVVLERSAEPAARPAGAAPWTIAPARADQAAALEALAREAFPLTRFHADPAFPRARCGDLYAAFVQRGMAGAPERLTLTDPSATCFNVCRLQPHLGVGTIELIAVAPQRRGEGLGAALAQAALAAFANAGLRRATVATQAANVASQRLYQRAGYRTCDVGLWLHRWFD